MQKCPKNALGVREDAFHCESLHLRNISRKVNLQKQRPSLSCPFTGATPEVFNGGFFWPVKYFFTQQMDVDNIFNTLRHKPCPVGVFPIGVVTSSQLDCGY